MLNPIYGSPVFLVPKKGPNKFRMVVDLRLLNKYSRKTPLDIPHLENALNHVQNAKWFATLDALSGYDFLRVAKGFEKFFTITTPFGRYEMQGAPMGWCNTAQYFSYRIIQQIHMPTGLYHKPNNGVIQWIDDTLLYATSFKELLKNMIAVIDQFMKMGVRLNIGKCDMPS